ncbi:uncharacterized protein BROUX77_005380 [Berkeleyomyces rouxiae]|uniref:uncharacterized protein n=1 Tax=Berkeleyomyces rouxiae TaxID=2035830 RepID=UPI003B76CBB6
MPLSFFSLLTTALTASQVALALPAPSPEPSVDATPSSTGSWSVKQARDVSHVIDGTASLVELYSKYRVLMPEDLKNAMGKSQKRGVVSASLIPAGTCGGKFSLPTKIGLVGNTIYNLVFDTASIGTWVHSPKTANPKALQSSYNHENRFATGNQVEGYTWGTDDPNGNSASGIGYYETVSVNGLTAKNQVLQVAETAPSSFHNLQSVSGVMGMGLTTISSLGDYPDYGFLERVRNKLDRNVFTVDMKHCSTGQVEFGDASEFAYYGYLGYAQVLDQDGYWKFKAQIFGGVDVKNIDMSNPDGKNIQEVIADTASDLVMLPLEYVEEYYAKVENAHYNKENAGFVYPCNSQLPDFTFLSGGTAISIPGRYLKLNLVDEELDLCFGALQSSEELGVNILGSPAFKSAFVVFNPSGREIGWARKELMDKEFGL